MFLTRLDYFNRKYPKTIKYRQNSHKPQAIVAIFIH